MASGQRGDVNSAFSDGTGLVIGFFVVQLKYFARDPQTSGGSATQALPHWLVFGAGSELVRRSPGVIEKRWRT